MGAFWITIGASLAMGLVVLALFAWELRVARRRGRMIASRGWILSNIGCGLLRTVAVALLQGILLAGYTEIAELSPWAWSTGAPLAWLAGFVAIDLAEYLSHRAAHASPLMWAMHAVHHQSPEYNLSLNFRLGVLGPLTGFPFHLLLALAGVPPTMFAILLPIQAAGMVATHARFPGTLGIFGRILVAPAWHRVHHSAAPAHRDRNFGACLIIWDRWFGTFSDGADTLPRWGIDGEPAPRDPLAANLAPFRALNRPQP